MRAVAVAVVAALGACSAPANLPDLAQAEARADANGVAGAVAAYQRAQTTCGRLRPKRRAIAACSDALLGEGDVLDRAGRGSDAIAVYLAIPPRTDDATTAATATYRAGDLLLKDHQVVPAWTQLRGRVVTDYPDEPLAADALKDLVADGRRRDARALAGELERLLTPLAQTDVADNILWWLADLTEHDFANPPDARALYDRIYTDYPQSGLRDDARWHAARLSRALGDPHGAVARLRALLATREVSVLAGSCFSIWLDDAQLELGEDPARRPQRPRRRDRRVRAAAARLPGEKRAPRRRALRARRDVREDRRPPPACAARSRGLIALEPDSKYRARADALAAERHCK